MEKRNAFVIAGTNGKLWNAVELTRYLTQHQNHSIALLVNPEAVCLNDLGVYQLLDCFQFEHVTIYTGNPFERHDRYEIRHEWWNTFLEQQPDIPNDLLQWSGDKRFLAMYFRPTANRLGLAAYLLRYHNIYSTVHFTADPSPDKLFEFEFDKLTQLRTDSLSDVSLMMPHMPITQIVNAMPNRHGVGRYEYDDDNAIDLYKHIFVDIVSEGQVSGRTFFPTEKTIRPMWLMKPFIVYASCNYLAYLRQMGFRTFSDFWSEDYDGYEGRERFLRILDLIDDLARRPAQELETMYMDMQFSLQHNLRLLKNQDYKRSVQYIE